MRDTSTLLYIHLIWRTWDSLPLLIDEIRTTVYTCIQDECVNMKTELLAIGGIADHIHLLVSIPPTISISTLVKQLKGSSSHLIGANLGATHFFKWQGAYAAVTISPPHVPKVRRYIENQEERHRRNAISPDLEFEE
jgi:REP element-mobilizing transposase RayT